VVSILVFLDQALKAGRGEGVVQDAHVSILVFLDQALKEGGAAGVRALLQVSILVFLDQALKASRATGGSPGTGFNPCFPGSSAESIMECLHSLYTSIVSILVFLDQALKDASNIACTGF